MRQTDADWEFDANESIIWYKDKESTLSPGDRRVKPFPIRAGCVKNKLGSERGSEAAGDFLIIPVWYYTRKGYVEEKTLFYNNVNN